MQPPLAEIRLEAGAVDVDRLVDDIDGAAAAIGENDEIRVVTLIVPAGASSFGGATPHRVAFRSLELMPQPVIAAVESAAHGAILELTLACDMRVAAQGASFSLQTATGGEAITLGATQRLPRLIGRTRATQMILLGEEVNAETALVWGLVNGVAPASEVRQLAQKVAASIASRGPLAVRYAKEAIARGLDMPLEQALRYETDLTVILQTTDDRAEGVRAFLEKRSPKFKGS
jgi:enoyl-CoA hydratase